MIMNYYTMITILSISIFAMLLVIVSSNKNFSKGARNQLKLAFIFAIVAILCEFIGDTLEKEMLGEQNNIHSLITLTKVIKFCIVPMMPFYISKAVFEKRPKSKKSKSIFKFLRTYLYIYEIILVLAFLMYKFNEFYGLLYIVYNINFIIGTAYMFVNAFAFCKYYQNKNEKELVSIMLFIVVFVTLQIFNPEIQILWLAIAMSATFIYIYYYELIQNIDGLTSLLNQKAFSNCKKDIEDEDCAIVIYDINDFKKINDNCGHMCGDKILIEVAKIMKNHYQKYGMSYRMGGDEFVVIMEKNIENAKEITEEFVKKVAEEVIIEKYIENDYIIENVEKLKEKLPKEINISYGISVYNPLNKEERGIDVVIQEADKEMYYYKNKYKNQNQ